MKKFNWKGKKFLGSLFTIVLISLGVANPELVAPVLTEITCGTAVECEA